MGGQDKGLLPWGTTTLAGHALARLAPQVGRCLLSANRHLDRHAALGVPVLVDLRPGFEGPLAGLEAALHHGTTPWLACVPCDVPDFPPDLVARLTEAAVAEGVATAFAVSGPQRRPQPLCCLVHRDRLDDLRAWLDAGQRKVMAWLQQRPHAAVAFDDAAAFANANTADDLRSLARG
ncbi:molybdenum cofactor guanylyltransferase MobA [Aquabacterium sp. J223]|uniref:molybdenum cofactor guanylyltransferase MobA n=1 Tax=Aquabacterium sp. J223 TaxID=2898431 RepID=UPI0021ADAD6F|nr:molybdenum cofactor guanylyltransferase MobA [Aquabacterium sp. J223]UUX97854.1 molybdenum cofactor guanylyltransferase [Aquabacterium sp. J223]